MGGDQPCERHCAGWCPRHNHWHVVLALVPHRVPMGWRHDQWHVALAYGSRLLVTSARFWSRGTRDKPERPTVFGALRPVLVLPIATSHDAQCAGRAERAGLLAIQGHTPKRQVHHGPRVGLWLWRWYRLPLSDRAKQACRSRARRDARLHPMLVRPLDRRR